MLKIIFELFVFYLLYKLIFDFIVPVYETTKQVKKQVREMNGRMDEMNRQQQQQTNNNQSNKSTTSKAPKDDYIDFEEVK